jgi:hypothetical protein
MSGAIVRDSASMTAVTTNTMKVRMMLEKSSYFPFFTKVDEYHIASP